MPQAVDSLKGSKHSTVIDAHDMNSTGEALAGQDDASQNYPGFREEPKDNNDVAKPGNSKEVKSEKGESLQQNTQTTEQGSSASEPIAKKALGIDDLSALSDNENLASIEDYQNAISFHVESSPLKDRIKRAPKRVLQQIAYATLVEDRIADLEKRLAKVESQGVDDQDSTAKRSDEEAILGLNRISFEEYRPKADVLSGGKSRIARPRDFHDTDDRPVATGPYHLIDVVVGSATGPDMAEDRPVQTPKRPLHNRSSITDRPLGTLASDEIPCQTPDRIRINSLLLLELLENITNQRFTETKHTDGSGYDSQVILKPFKLLVIYEKDIKESAKRLAQKHMPGNIGEVGLKPTNQSNGVTSETPSVAIAAVESSGRGDSQDQEILSTQPMTKAETKRLEAKNRLESKRAFEELEVLLELYDDDLKPIFDMRRQIDQCTLRSIAFPDLWHLFRHGEDLCSSEVHPQVYRILNLTGGRPLLITRDEVRSASRLEGLTDSMALNISCFFYSFNGKEFGPVQQTFQITKYDDVKLITSLPVYPVKFSNLKSETLTREGLIGRGKRYFELTQNKSNVVHKRYNGLTLDLEQLREEVDSEVIIDTGMALLKNPSLEINLGITSSFVADPRETTEFLDVECPGKDAMLGTKVLHSTPAIWNPSEEDKDMQDSDFIICPSSVFGYVLRSRKWVRLNVGLVENIEEHSGGFESLVLPPGHKSTLLALVETHSRGKRPNTGQKSVERQIDLVRGKGKGLLILLHGEPGVGKTSTAECVAEHTGRPLFQETCGDIGESAEAVEKTLENHFQLAHRWGCVLLLDEADVFLMRRNKTDLKRNAIVSVFLRVLEYYSGILFLTTNRVGVFDQAFRSRLHICLYYPKLNQKNTTAIWKMNLDRIQKHWGDSIKITPKDHADILKHAENHFNELKVLETTWNGRQIRNAFQTAIAHQDQLKYDLPESPKPALEVKHFKKVAEASKHFDEYLRQTAGLEADMARESGERRDDMDVDGIKESIAKKTKRAQRS